MNLASDDGAKSGASKARNATQEIARLNLLDRVLRIKKNDDNFGGTRQTPSKLMEYRLAFYEPIKLC